MWEQGKTPHLNFPSTDIRSPAAAAVDLIPYLYDCDINILKPLLILFIEQSFPGKRENMK